MNQTRRTFLAATGAVAVGGCLGGPGSAEAPSVDEASLLLNWKPSGLHAPFYVAKSRGYYEAQGLTVSKIESGDGSDFSAKQVGLGNTEFAVTSSDQVLNVNSRDLSPLAVGVIMQHSPVVVFTSRDRFGTEFTDVSQLEGKTVGTGPGMVRVLTKLLLKRAGVLDSVTIEDTGYDTVQMLLSGRIDAAGGVFGDVVDTRHQGATVDSVRVANAVPTYGHVVATPSSFANEHPQTVRAFLRGTARGMAWATLNPEAAVDTIVDAVSALDGSRQNELDKWKLMVKSFVMSPTVSEHGWGWNLQEPWTRMADAMRTAGMLGGGVNPDAVWTNDHLDTEFEYIGSYAQVVD